MCAGKINKMTDTTIVTKIGDYEITFNTKKAEYTNGVVMPGDSVTVHYIGDLKEKWARALLIRLIPSQSNVVNAVHDSSKELMTAPKSEEDVKQLEEFVKKEKEDRRKGKK